MSQTSTCARPPASRMDCAVASAAPPFRSKTATAIPSSPRRIAMARPIPLPPPVTIATLPLNPRTSTPSHQDAVFHRAYGMYAYHINLFLSSQLAVRLKQTDDTDRRHAVVRNTSQVVT